MRPSGHMPCALAVVALVAAATALAPINAHPQLLLPQLFHEEQPPAENGHSGVPAEHGGDRKASLLKMLLGGSLSPLAELFSSPGHNDSDSAQSAHDAQHAVDGNELIKALSHNPSAPGDRQQQPSFVLAPPMAENPGSHTHDAVEQDQQDQTADTLPASDGHQQMTAVDAPSASQTPPSLAKSLTDLIPSLIQAVLNSDSHGPAPTHGHDRVDSAETEPVPPEHQSPAPVSPQAQHQHEMRDIPMSLGSLPHMLPTAEHNHEQPSDAIGSLMSLVNALRDSPERQESSPGHGSLHSSPAPQSAGPSHHHHHHHAERSSSDYLPHFIEHDSKAEPVPHLCPELPPTSGPEHPRDYGFGDAPQRIVSFGDIHGDYAALVHVLRLFKLVDPVDECRWIGGNTVVVQTGDLTDRGPHVFFIYKLLLHLRHQARAQGGGIELLNGNHEIMNYMQPRGDGPYVNKDDIAEFGGDEKRARAFSADGDIGRIIAQAPVMLRIAQYLFAHGGVLPKFAKLGARHVNERARSELRGVHDGHLPDEQCPRGAICPLSPSNGITWARSLIPRRPHHDHQACNLVSRVLRDYAFSDPRSANADSIERIFLGHTIMNDGVTPCCGGHLVGMDAGMSSYMDWNGEPSYKPSLAHHRHIGGVQIIPSRRHQPDEVQVIRYHRPNGHSGDPGTFKIKVERINVPIVG